MAKTTKVAKTTSEFLEGYTLEDYNKKVLGAKCTICETSLDSVPLEHFDHESGWRVKDFPQRQWLFKTCPKCHYQVALWKLGVPRL